MFDCMSTKWSYEFVCCVFGIRPILNFSSDEYVWFCHYFELFIFRQGNRNQNRNDFNSCYSMVSIIRPGHSKLLEFEKKDSTGCLIDAFSKYPDQVV